MSASTNTLPDFQQRVYTAVVEFQKRLLKKGVVLDKSNNENTLYLHNYMVKNNLDLTNVEHFMEAYRALAPKGLLVFEKGFEPAALKRKHDFVTPAEIIKQATQEGEKREKLARAEEEKAAHQKAEEKAKADVEAVISNYRPVDHRTNTIAYGRQAVWQEKTRETIKKCQARNASYLPGGSGWREVKPFSWQSTLKMVLKLRDDAYKAEEQAASRM